MTASELTLKYGSNPHQIPASIRSVSGPLPFEVLNGDPGYINFLDALNSWQLVRDLKAATHLPSAASFKHVSPAGAAVGLPLSEPLRQAYFIADSDLSPLASAYARARGADRVSSYGDWAALSDTVDASTASLLRCEFSLGVIAPGYEPEALDILRKKLGGKYPILQIDSEYEPEETESREVFGLSLTQRRNDLPLTAQTFSNTVTKVIDLPDQTVRDILVATIALKYTQSNAVCFAHDGQVIGMGAGQQSRIHCTRIAATKADTWRLRQHPSVINLPFRKGLKRAEKDNAIDQYFLDDLTEAEERVWQTAFTETPTRLSPEARRDWLSGLDDVVMSSDGYIPFRDNVDRAQRSGVQVVVQPGGSIYDQQVTDACNEYGIAMVLSGVRLFHH